MKAIWVAAWLGMALAGSEPAKPVVKSKGKPAEKAPASADVDTSSLPAYKESVEKLGTKVMDDVDDTVKRLNQEALEIE